MPESIVITCPDCHKQLKGPAELIGKKIRCKACGHIFTVKAPAAAKTKPAPAPAKTKPAPAAKSAAAAQPLAEVLPVKEKPPASHADDVEGKNPYQITDIVLGHRCPQCAADMAEEDIICLSCGYNTQTRMRTSTVLTIENTTGEWVVWLAPGVLLALLAFVAVATICFLWLYFNNRDDTGARLQLIFAMQIWGSVFAAFVAWFSGRYAFKRLFINYRPPEKPLR
jgi:hypothetical protein